MTILSNLSIDLTDFTGRILIVSDLYGHFELLLKGLYRGPLGKRKLSHAKTIFCTAVEKDERPAVH